MQLMNRNIRTLSDLDLSPNEMRSVLSLRIGADVAKECNLEQIFFFIKGLDRVRLISMADDYLDPKDLSTKYFISKVENEIGDIALSWFCEGKVDGRHGR
ncbi:MAG TPA: hypothetical protein VL129_16240 [Pseudomonas sp.]|uniref:hypothetical protein n=1 Tax=Pseudomonas sp. TaxID=306 RepID=UPI002D10182F|nr:hypothetical protein [Pseudomonas sp.]HTO20675.1 hypothetical protein [Pseudomonas sp.]